MTRYFYLLLLPAVLVLAGCAGGIVERDDLQAAGGTYHKREVVLRDVPLPRDFHVGSGSFCHGTPSFRYGEFMLAGPFSVDELYFFYKRQMPDFNWREVSAQNYETSAKLKFEKPKEFCTILCREGEAGTELKITVEQKKS